jgi:xanthine dehydrogenase accessory factor
MIHILEQALNLLRQGNPLVEATVIMHSGSTPRAAGAKMVIDPEGNGYGTIGGGLLEAVAMQTARSVMQSGRSRILSFDLTGQDAAAMDMICGGRTQVLLDLVVRGPETSLFFEERCKALAAGRRRCFLTILEGVPDDIRAVTRCPLEPERPIPGLSPTLEERVREQAAHTPYLSVVAAEDRIVVVEAIGAFHTVYLFGAGHVAVDTAHFAARVGFRVVVLDDRAEFANAGRFPDAHQIQVVSDFNRAFDGIEVDADAFVVIITRGHIHDQTVLAKALSTNAAYIGMIGSRRKRDAIYDALLAEGVSREDLQRVRSPIGLAIDAETPEEIAVSIVAEMIRERARLNG